MGTQTALRSSTTTAAWIAIVGTAAAILFLAALHVLSPEFDPSWRVVSEYADGQYGWVLSLMFAAWAVGTFALAFALRAHVASISGKIGLILLIVAGVGEAMAAAFDINHPLHGLASILGILGLPIAAMLITADLRRNPAWAPAKGALTITANLTWISVLLMAASFGGMFATFQQSGVQVNEPPEVLPPGVIGVVGWANRLVILAYCAWALVAAWWARRSLRA